MLNCEQFRFLAGADPRHLTWGQRMHRLICRTCGPYLKSMQAFDHQIEMALDTDVPPEHLRRPAGEAPAGEAGTGQR